MPPGGRPPRFALREPKALSDGQEIGRARGDRAAVEPPHPIHIRGHFAGAGIAAQHAPRDRPEAVAGTHHVVGGGWRCGPVRRRALGLRRWCPDTGAAGFGAYTAGAGREVGAGRCGPGRLAYGGCLERRSRVRAATRPVEAVGRRRWRRRRWGCRELWPGSGRRLGKERWFGLDRRRHHSRRDGLQFLPQLLQFLQRRFRQVLAFGFIVGKGGAGRGGGHDGQSQGHASSRTAAKAVVRSHPCGPHPRLERPPRLSVRGPSGLTKAAGGGDRIRRVADVRTLCSPCEHRVRRSGGGSHPATSAA